MINTSSSHTTFRRVWTNHFSFIIIPRLVGLDHFYVISGMRGEGGVCNQPGKRFQIILSLNFTLFSLLSFPVSFPTHTQKPLRKKKQTNKQNLIIHQSWYNYCPRPPFCSATTVYLQKYISNDFLPVIFHRLYFTQ